MLYQNFPNPFNPKTKIRYDVFKRTKIKLKIFDINGRKVIELVNQEHVPGTYEAEFDGGALSSGIYLGILNAEDFKDVIKMILIK
ncbi:MAG: T9SS type A sorting domain-containing protein [Ignavibacteria bacterium]|nr:T9SS type A sorting domain-containing protein [Ignavibacteria bacterium]